MVIVSNREGSMRNVPAPEGGPNASVVPLLYTVAVESQAKNCVGKRREAHRKKKVSFVDKSRGDMAASEGDAAEVTPQVTACLEGLVLESRVEQSEGKD